MEKTNNNKCHHFLEQICDELAEDINSPLCQEMQEHLNHCEKCCTSLESMRITVKLFKQIYNQKVPSDVDKKLWEKLGLDKH